MPPRCSDTLSVNTLATCLHNSNLSIHSALKPNECSLHEILFDSFHNSTKHNCISYFATNLSELTSQLSRIFCRATSDSSLVNIRRSKVSKQSIAQIALRSEPANLFCNERSTSQVKTQVIAFLNLKKHCLQIGKRD